MLHPNGRKLARLNGQEIQGSILSNFSTHVRDGEVSYWEYPKHWEKVQATVLSLVLSPY